MRGRYAILLVLTTLLLTGGAVFSFVQIGALSARRAPAAAPWLATTAQLDTSLSPVIPTAADYARFTAEDSAWRASHAREYTLAEIRARGDGRRTPRQAMQDRVFGHVRGGRRSAAIVELEKWVNAHSADADAILWLARLLNEAGRTDDSIRRYRQLIALQDER